MSATCTAVLLSLIGATRLCIPLSISLVLVSMMCMLAVRFSDCPPVHLSIVHHALSLALCTCG